ncbi:MAG TPA: alpha/beta hydrolase [Ferruginibacter sp.]|nr:alpha/beta hydrolase [Ferruginibacter sp.]
MRYFLIALIVFSSLSAAAQDTLGYTKTEIIYARKDGMALTMMMLVPKERSNGKAIISVLNGNWVSAPRMMDAFSTRPSIYVAAGYTVFGVMVSSQPRYTIPDEITDLKRAVRFIRYNARQYNIDADHIGITGTSSGGHLSLMIATADDKTASNSFDPVDKVSARVQAAAVFYPPTDFINYGKPNPTNTINQQALVFANVAAAFDFRAWNDTTKTFVSLPYEKRLQLARDVSPVNFVSSDDPPVMFIHGNADMLVPLQQSETIIARLKAANVPTDLIIKNGGSHGWRNREIEEKNFVDWFDKYLK